MDKLKARNYFGEFMTRRWDPGIENFTNDLSLILKRAPQAFIDMSDVKFMSISFFDEVFRKVSQKGVAGADFGKVQFSTKLDQTYLDHLKNLQRLLP